MYGCESWAIKKAEHQRNWCFWTVVLEKTLESLLDCKEIKPVHPKGNQSWIFIGRADAEAEAPILWPRYVKSWLIGKDPDAGKNWRQEEKGMTEDEMAGWHHWLDGRESQWTPGVDDGQGGLACCNSWGRRESDTTERVNWTEVNWYNLTLWDLIQLFPLYPFCHNLSSIGHHLCFLRESQQLSSYLLGLLYIYSFSKKHKIILLNKN